MGDEFLFVYGTLRKETATAMSCLLASHSEYLCEAVIQGRLYEVDGYPGAVESQLPEDRVYGALHRIVDSKVLLPALDAYEECTEQTPEPHEYIRKKALITGHDKDTVVAWVYLFNREVSGLSQIKSGDYLNDRDGSVP